MTNSLPFYLSTRVVADALGLHHETVWRWCKEGRIRATRLNPQPHYTDDRPRKSNRAYWRIELDSVYELLRDAYAGRPVPRAIRERLRRLARPLEPGTVRPTTMPDPRGPPSSEGGKG